MVRTGFRLLTMLSCLLLLSSEAVAYYHFARVDSSRPNEIIPVKFDLGTLPGGMNTVLFLLPGERPAGLRDGDSYTSLISQFQAAAEAWDGVETSALRLKFGGLASKETVLAGPRIEIRIEETAKDLPRAYTEVFLAAQTRKDADGKDFWPIDHAVIYVSPSKIYENQNPFDNGLFSEGLFGVLLHEFGHAVGLQHTFTSSAMSTQIMRAVTKGRPVFADDAAGISFLYPTTAFRQNFGRIRGRVTMAGVGVHMASVVALTSNGPAYSALTNPDGTYEIAGLPAANYHVFAHPIPPAEGGETTRGGLRYPWDERGRDVVPSAYFSGRFYPNVEDAREARAIPVQNGSGTTGVDFQVARRAAPAIHSVASYNFPSGGVEAAFVKPGFLVPDKRETRYLYLAGQGLLNGRALAAGLEVNALGGSALVEQSQYFEGYALVYFGFSPLTPLGPRHLYLRRDGDVYLLPVAFDVVRDLAPRLSTVSEIAGTNGGTLSVLGNNVSMATTVLFDGVRARNIGVDAVSGALMVATPAGNPGETTRLVAVNPDRQSSLFWRNQDVNAPVYSFRQYAPPTIGLNLTSLPAGAEAVVEVIGASTQFDKGPTNLSFGSAEVTVRKIWVVDANRLMANVSVSPAAANTTVSVTAQAALQVARLPLGFQILPPDRQRFSLVPVPINRETGRLERGAYLGRSITLQLSQQWPGATTQNSAIRWNGETIAPGEVTATSVTFVPPASARPGPARVQLLTGGVESYPVLVDIDYAPPELLSLTTEADIALESAAEVRAGTKLKALVTGLTDGSILNAEDVRVLLGQAQVRPTSVTENNGAVVVEFDLPTVDGNAVEVRVGNRDRLTDARLLRVVK